MVTICGRSPSSSVREWTIMKEKPMVFSRLGNIFPPRSHLAVRFRYQLIGMSSARKRCSFTALQEAIREHVVLNK